ncbi:resolvase [Bacteroidia bacterium]|nr:resolvase [Bacteroidia bacterium]
MKIGYARVSSRGQDLQIQIESLEKEGCQRIYQEKISAFKERPEFQKALDELRSGDVFVVWSLDRLGRSIFQIFDTVKQIQDKGAELKVIIQQIDTTTAPGKVYLTVFALLAELETDLRRERTAAGLQAAKSRGIKPGRKKGLTPEAEKKADSAKKLYLSKEPIYSVREISKMLNISTRTLYNYLTYNGVKLKRDE